MESLHIIVGTELGSTAQIARFVQNELSDQFDVTVNTEPVLNDILRNDQRLLFMTANTGRGVLPLNIKPLYEQLESSTARLDERQFLLINFGDSIYPTFGAAGHQLYSALLRLGAKSPCDPLIIDASKDRYPQPKVLNWITEQLTKL